MLRWLFLLILSISKSSISTLQDDVFIWLTTQGLKVISYNLFSIKALKKIILMVERRYKNVIKL